ncbi:hypothetical protein GEI7407_1194 [Geitlerinema sp. PCC 7407]|nr:hypothetical protein GEI7407_1194 [Geitlerinema sp. PCC 7407]
MFLWEPLQNNPYDMNAVLPRIIKSAYRREPVFCFAVTIGCVDAFIGGFGESTSLTLFGLGTIGLALAYRWWQFQQYEPEESEPVPQRYLPPNSSQAPLPIMNPTPRHPR